MFAPSLAFLLSPGIVVLVIAVAKGFRISRRVGNAHQERV